MWRLNDSNDDALFYRLLRNVHNPSPEFVTKVVLLNTAFEEIQDGTIFSKEETNELTNFISDGQIDIDTTRGTRRTAVMTLLNPSAEFTPALEDFDPEGPWVGKIYLNRVVRIYRGIRSGSRRLYVPVGTFMIDVAEVLVEQNMSLVNLTMSDLWKKLTKSTYSHPKTYKSDDNVFYNDIINDMLQASGANQPLAPNIDNLASRDNSNKKLQKNINIEEGQSRGDLLKELGKRWDIDMYFDPLGRFITEDRRDARDSQEVWQFRGAEQTTDDGANLISLQRSFNDDNLYNHVVVVGTQNEKNTIRVEKRDDSKTSRTSIELIGDRVFFFKSEKIGSTGEANNAMNRLWKLRFQISEELRIDGILNPGLEGDDVVRITERNKAKVDGAYRLQSFNIPLVTARQSMLATNIVREPDL